MAFPSYKAVVVSFGLVVGIAVLNQIRIWIYRIYFHPLARFPGPKLYAASDFPLAYKSFIQGRFYREALPLHEKYGDIVRIGPETLAIDGRVGWNDVFGHKTGGKQEFGRNMDFDSPGNAATEYKSIVHSNQENHRRCRKLMSHAFSESAMYEQEPIITQYIDLLMVQLRKRAEAGETVDMLKWINFTTFDIIGDLTFAEPFHCLDSSEYHPWVSMIYAYIRANARGRFLAMYPLLKPLWAGSVTKEEQAEFSKLLAHRKFAYEKTERRLAAGTAPDGRKDFFSYILRHNDEKGMRMPEILANGEDLILAGSETTSTVLSGWTYYLCSTPQAMERVKNEVRTAFKNESEITMRSVTKLPYLVASLEEAMRMYPPAAETPPRVSPGDTVNGEYIPKGTTINIYQWACYHRPSNFVQPSVFKPERWLTKHHPYYDAQFEDDNKTTFQPFSFGPRNCIGKNLAYSEMRLITSRLLWNFDLTLADKADWNINHRVFIGWEKTPLLINLKLAKHLSE